MDDPQYLSTDPNAGAAQYLSTDPGAGTPMNFAVVNGQRVPVDDTGISAFVSHAAAQVNPITMSQGLVSAVTHPVETAKGFTAQQQTIMNKGLDAYHQGDYLTAGRHAVDWMANYVLPGGGTIMDLAADRMQHGDYMAALGDTVGFALNLFAGPKVVGKTLEAGVNARVPSLLPRNVNPQEAAAVAFGQREGIPVDAGTMTGNPFVKGVQTTVDTSPIGSVVAQRAAGRTARALETTGQRMAGQVYPSAVTPEQAGAAVSGGLEDLIGTLHEQANQAYGQVRKLEAMPEAAEPVPATTPPAVLDRMEAQLGRRPTGDELSELRRMRAELEAMPYKRGKAYTTEEGEPAYDYRAAGAPVFHDIAQASPGAEGLTRGEVLGAINKALTTGRFDNPAIGALRVARQRLGLEAGEFSPPTLPPGAGDVEQTVQFPVDLGPVQDAMRPSYERLTAENAVTPLTGPKASALRALDRLMNAPQTVGLSVADAVSSDLKAMARGAALPELRNVGQGVAAKAVAALEKQIEKSATGISPAVLQLLKEGRGATAAKYAASELLEQIKSEPVRAFGQATAARDQNIELLRHVQAMNPEAIPKIGRAFLDQLLERAQDTGGFTKAAGLERDWQKLGPATKQMLFGNQVEDLNHFFRLANLLEKTTNFNPSRTAVTHAAAAGAALWAEPLVGSLYAGGTGILSAMLHSPAALKLLNRSLQLSVGSVPRSAIVRAQALNLFGRAAAQAGVTLPATMPAAATAQSPNQ